MGFLWADFIAGLVGGGSGIIVGHPLDTIKVRLQAQSVATIKYNGVLDCIVKTFKRESIFGFYKGMAFPLATISVQNALVFGVYGNTLHQLSKWRYGDPNKASSNSDILIAGCVGGFVQLSLACPVDLVKIRLQMQMEKRESLLDKKKIHYKGPVDCLRSICKSEGIPGCYRGLTIMLMRDVPANGIYFLSYEVLCRKLTSKSGKSPSPFVVLLAGGLAGALSWAAINPLDVIKSRLQADGVKGHKYNSIYHCVVDSYRTSGLRVFWTGLTINCLRGFPVNAVTFLVYSLILRELGGQSRASDTLLSE
ncbi:solute carrier family 25 member 45-like [Saccoglossus kowalevskii]|uniref:Solute carrier family 25 member 48-like n=1 Tax=Saccoglossus kowalevskii TaxID=10224 RepID=A0ABM0GT65_SACKO|nr:PREDICTED: solute carrier family 25 member 48-like [Saccoglossus kowalevskii]